MKHDINMYIPLIGIGSSWLSAGAVQFEKLVTARVKSFTLDGGWASYEVDEIQSQFTMF